MLQVELLLLQRLGFPKTVSYCKFNTITRKKANTRIALFRGISIMMNTMTCLEYPVMEFSLSRFGLLRAEIDGFGDVESFVVSYHPGDFV